MKLLLIADTHCKLANRDTYLECFKQIDELAQKENVDKIIHLGDLFHNKAIIRSECLRDISDIFNNSKFEWIILTGNHDYENSNCEGHSLKTLENINNVSVIDSNSSYYDMYKEKDKLLFIAYENIEKFKEKLEGWESKDITLFIHQSIEGFDYWNYDNSDKNVIPRELLKNFRIFSGHIHKYQQIENITYVGSPFTQKFDEANEKKYVVSFDTETKQAHRIELNLPKHVQYEIEINSQEDFKSLKNLDIKQNDLVKVKIKGEKSLLNKVNKHLFQNERIVLQKEYIDNSKKVLIKDSYDIDSMFEIYLKNLDTNVDKNKLLEYHKRVQEELNL